MLSNFFSKMRLMWSDTTLRKRLFFVIAALIASRFLAAVPIPGIDALRLEQFVSGSQLFGLLNLFSGGGLSTLSIVMLGVGPYITSSIVMQLLTVLIPRLKQLYQEEGEAGRERFTQYSRLLTLPFAAIQGAALLIVLEKQGVLPALDPFAFLTNLAVVIAGSVLLMWVGELISEFGIGNGVSLLIFAGIVASFHSTVGQLVFSFDQTQIPVYLAFIAVGAAIIAGVVFITEAERPIPVTYAKRVRGNRLYGGISTYLPLRLNQAGVIPIIFAISLLLFPQMIFGFLAQLGGGTLSSISSYINSILSNQLFYGAFYFLLVFVFTYFYTAVTFDPKSISENLQKSGAFIPGVRPGEATAEHLTKVILRITLFGALFLGAIAVLPIIMQAATGIIALSLGGTALLIVVSVVLDLIRKVDAQVAMREY